MPSFSPLTSIVAFANVALAVQGSATFYLPNHGIGHCGWPINNMDWAVALPNSHYDGGAHCGKGIVVHHKGKTLTGIVADSCPGCADNQLDLDEGFFDQFDLESVGRINVDWHFA